MGGLVLLPSRRALRRLDVLAVVSVLVFAALGVTAGMALAGLGGLGSGLADVARSLDLAARGIALLGEVPLVGEPAGRLADSVAQAGVSVGTNAQDVRDTAGTVAVVVGAAIVLLPLPVVAGVYLPLRLSRRREVRGLRRLVGGSVEASLVEHLAHGAVSRIPYSDLLRITRTPWEDLATGRHHRLAASELERLGVTPPPSWRDGRDGQRATPARPMT